MAAWYMIADSSCNSLPSRLVLRVWAKPQQSAEVLHTPERMALAIDIEAMNNQSVPIARYLGLRAGQNLPCDLHAEVFIEGCKRQSARRSVAAPFDSHAARRVHVAGAQLRPDLRTFGHMRRELFEEEFLHKIRSRGRTDIDTRILEGQRGSVAVFGRVIGIGDSARCEASEDV